MNDFSTQRLFWGAVLVSLLSGCASNTPAPVVNRSAASDAGSIEPDMPKPAAVAERVARKGYYIVKEGDTLYRIALDHGQGYRDLAAWNNLVDANRIVVGQELRVVAPDLDDAQTVAIAKPVGLAKPVEQRALDGNSEALKTQPKAGREAYSDEAFARLEKGGDTVPARSESRTEGEVKVAQKVEVKPASVKSEDDLQWIWPATGKVAAPFVEGTSKGIDLSGKKGDPVLAVGDGKVVYSGSGLRGYGQLLIVKHNNTYLTAYAHNSKVLVKEGQSVSRGQKIAEMGDTEADQVKLHFEVRRQGKPVDPLKYLPPR